MAGLPASLHASVRWPCGWFMGLLLADVMAVRVACCDAWLDFFWFLAMVCLFVVKLALLILLVVCGVVR